MVKFTATLKQFEDQGEKTGWTYIDIPEAIAQKLKPGNKKSFRVKGKLDDFAITAVALMPMGGGDFVMAINAAMRKGIHKQKGAKVIVNIEEDKKGKTLNKQLVACIKDEPEALKNFEKMSPSHRQYYSNWIDEAKTDATKTKRIAQTIRAMALGMDYGQMIRYEREQREKNGF